MISRDLPPMPHKTKQETLHDLARAGLTFGDCLEFFAAHRTEEALYYVKHAQEHRKNKRNLEVDDNALVAVARKKDTSAKGVYVMSWLWVPKQIRKRDS